MITLILSFLSTKETGSARCFKTQQSEKYSDFRKFHTHSCSVDMTETYRYYQYQSLIFYIVEYWPFTLSKGEINKCKLHDFNAN